jgi:hypothetical protein
VNGILQRVCGSLLSSRTEETHAACVSIDACVDNTLYVYIGKPAKSIEKQRTTTIDDRKKIAFQLRTGACVFVAIQNVNVLFIKGETWS